MKQFGTWLIMSKATLSWLPKRKVLIANEALAECVGLLPRAFEREVSEVVDLVAGTHHGVVAVGDSRVHLFHAGERTPLA
jgi:hypothetical protein